MIDQTLMLTALLGLLAFIVIEAKKSNWQLFRKTRACSRKI